MILLVTSLSDLHHLRVQNSCQVLKLYEQRGAGA